MAILLGDVPGRNEALETRQVDREIASAVRVVVQVKSLKQVAGDIAVFSLQI